MITYDQFDDTEWNSFRPAKDDVTKGASTLLQWAYDTYGDDLVYACSFGAESMVLIDLIAKAKPDAKLVFLDTGLHFQETYDLIEEVKTTYPQLQIKMQQPELTVDEQSEQYGPALWSRNPDQCCYLRKIRPLERALSGVTAWVSGLRREQSPSRANTNFINKDERFKSVKVCPLIHWSWDDVWDYIDEHQLPYNKLHDQQFPSIGCIPCTQPVTDSSEERSGRWAGFNKTECGIHVASGSQ
ncbi:hypothetical protein J416_01729 [Gracilibacillus halophilus YIM-C55.5]|uniref:Adenosine 5'-phosphosulfate reductase n=1 Tax=Gracilibacillus halophilus YIM-C55.5 TaxID=1308866 RepID=N4WFX6_9BACI|nr:phosphoadenylyl-sulfate reductase [Gracilibacillus halophilus]ENH98174.1 hypothetical protein J416_01729 [Gracilibacillus halophilus YIM-C55.5]